MIHVDEMKKEFFDVCTMVWAAHELEQELQL